MLDVHVPHPTHTWRDFFIHIATITVGLLIAVSLEQAVESIHHHRQRQELIQSLLEDAKKATLDAEEYGRYINLRNAWLRQRLAQVRLAISTRQPLSVSPPFIATFPNTPDSPSWTAAKSSGLLSVLSQDEIRSFGEAANLSIDFSPLATEESTLRFKTRRFDQIYLTSDSPDRYDFSTAASADLKEYLDLLLTEQTSLNRADLWLRYIRGADAALLEGSRDLDVIEKAELRFITAEPAK